VDAVERTSLAGERFIALVASYNKTCDLSGAKSRTAHRALGSDDLTFDK
jgi:hypothetical protein